MKCFVSLRNDFCVCAIGCSNLSTNDDSLSVGPSQPEINILFVDFSERIEYWDSRRIACLRKPFFSHVII